EGAGACDRSRGLPFGGRGRVPGTPGARETCVRRPPPHRPVVRSRRLDSRARSPKVVEAGVTEFEREYSVQPRRGVVVGRLHLEADLPQKTDIPAGPCAPSLAGGPARDRRVGTAGPRPGLGRPRFRRAGPVGLTYSPDGRYWWNGYQWTPVP